MYDLPCMLRLCKHFVLLDSGKLWRCIMPRGILDPRALLGAIPPPPNPPRPRALGSRIAQGMIPKTFKNVRPQTLWFLGSFVRSVFQTFSQK